MRVAWPADRWMACRWSPTERVRLHARLGEAAIDDAVTTTFAGAATVLTEVAADHVFTF
ncbi:hypothetical protein [Natrinema sp. 1APR25-10V2]|uniref:hypothetical protein n=1 Tax=Natrinema sp. 1APR25-10V2 TaxID=2951081 RepID=UPI0028755F05|nr:hypothetical protein [Natrinema sp. 1APR25-10V2]MDS0475655.1 hypothetical protein [Natrinema sp. 1APR25-10V2]